MAEKAKKEGQAKVRAEEAKAMATQFKQERKQIGEVEREQMREREEMERRRVAENLRKN